MIMNMGIIFTEDGSRQRQCTVFPSSSSSDIALYKYYHCGRRMEEGQTDTHTHTHTHTQCSSTFSMEMFRRKISKISSGIMQRAGNEKEEEDQMRYNTEEKCITGIITLLWLLLLAPEKR
jgi:carbohydrate-binding DOMON domain-containing protein